jgi:hypothetical protein
MNEEFRMKNSESGDPAPSEFFIRNSSFRFLYAGVLVALALEVALFYALTRALS